MPNQSKSTVELGYVSQPGLTGPPTLTLTKQLKYKETSAKIDTIF